VTIVVCPQGGSISCVFKLCGIRGAGQPGVWTAAVGHQWPGSE